jgi:hypothetical protein
MTDFLKPPGARSDAIPPETRDRVVQALTHGFARDQLSEGELETLLDRVYGARTLSELNGLIQNLPVLRSVAEVGGGSVESAGPGPAVESRSADQINALFSGQERKLTGVLPRRMWLNARLGYVELDLTRATFQPGVTEIDVRALMGYLQIRFPADVQVESDGNALFGFFTLKGGGCAEAAGSERVVRLTGRAILGFAECFVSSGRRLESGTS